MNIIRNKKVIAIIVAGGIGKRFSNKIPKQYLEINNCSIIRHTILRFLTHSEIDHVQVIINKKHTRISRNSLKGLNILPVVYGGKNRQESVLKGLKAIKKLNPQKVLVHDAARPNISKKLISLIIKNIKNNIATVPGIPTSDTLVNSKDGLFTYIDKNEHKLIQTPQGFMYSDLYKLHLNAAKENLNDDSELFIKYPNKINIIDGEPSNIKITFKEDFRILDKLMKKRIEIAGLGFDIHKFSSIPSKTIRLGGIDIKYSKQLEGHSDADVVLHALVDSLLGTISKGDIGKAFSNKEKKWKNADSKIFVNYALTNLYKLGCIIRHVDITIICEEPKISPHVNKMRKNISKLLNISDKCVSIKATTSEGLGFIGKKKGIIAKCLATISRPIEYNE